MEIKAKLLKPYTEEQRLDFIVEQNHNKGYELKETEKELQAWGYTTKEITKAREEQFNKDFFNTSLGYIRREVTMKNGSKDFLSDLLPTITKAVEMGMETKVIAYDKPPFDKEITDWTPYQHNEIVTLQFIQECMKQLQADFGIVEVK